MAQIDFTSIFVPSIGIAEMILRGSLIYVALFVILRFISRRQAGQLGPADLLVIVLIADAAQNGLGRDYRSVTEGIVLVLTIVGWDYLIDWLAFRYSSLDRLLYPPALKLVEDGRAVEENLRREMIGDQELVSQLREKGVEHIEAVKAAWLEGNGRVSVIERKQ